MNAALMAQLTANLKSLRLAAIGSQLDGHLRQARENSQDYAEFLLNLTDLEVSTRMENGCKRRIRDAKFPLVKSIESFKFEAAPELDLRLIKELLSGQYLKEPPNPSCLCSWDVRLRPGGPDPVHQRLCAGQRTDRSSGPKEP